MADTCESKDTLLMGLSCTLDGLTIGEARARQRRYGPNEITFRRGRSPWRMLAAEFTALFTLLLLAASALCFLAHYLSPHEGYELIMAVLLVVELRKF